MSKNDAAIKERKTVITELSVHPDIDPTMSDFQKEFLSEELAELPTIKEGDVNIFAAYIFDMGDKYESTIYIRNGLNQEINFENVLLHIVDQNGNVVGSQICDLKELGKIPSMSARPWKIYFDKQNVKVDEINKDDYKIVFDTRIAAKRTIDLKLENMPNNISLQLKEKYEEFLKELPRIQPGQISISTYSLGKDSKDNIVITIMFRNGTSKAVKIDKLPVKVVDKEGNIIVNGTFDLAKEEVKVGARCARLHRFIFPEGSVANKDVDLDECRVEFNQ